MSMTIIENTTNKNTTITEQQNHNYYNNNYRDTQPGVRVLTRDDGETILAAYLDNINPDGMTGAVAAEIEKAYAAGLSVEDIVLAIEETGFAPRPSPAYLRAILRNWAFSGVTVIRSPLTGTTTRVNNARPWYKVDSAAMVKRERERR